MKDSKIIFNFRVIIHTAEMLSDTLDNADRLEEINRKPYIIKHNAKPTKKGYLFPLNANKLHNEEIITLTDFLTAIQQIQADLSILIELILLLIQRLNMIIYSNTAFLLYAYYQKLQG